MIYLYLTSTQVSCVRADSQYYLAHWVSKYTSHGNAIMVTTQTFGKCAWLRMFAKQTSHGCSIIIHLAPCTVHNYWHICQIHWSWEWEWKELSVMFCLTYTLTEAESLMPIPPCCTSCWLSILTSRNMEDALKTSCRSVWLDLLCTAGLLHSFLIRNDRCCLWSVSRFSNKSKTSASRSSPRLKKVTLSILQKNRKGNMLHFQTLTKIKDCSLCWNGDLLGVSVPCSDILKEHFLHPQGDRLSFRGMLKVSVRKERVSYAGRFEGIRPSELFWCPPKTEFVTLRWI